MKKYYFHIISESTTTLDTEGVYYSSPFKAITEGELNLLTLALKAKVKGTEEPVEVVIVEDGKTHKFIAVRGTGSDDDEAALSAYLPAAVSPRSLSLSR